MTFTEAAIEVLRRAGQPLAVTDLTRLAVEGSLLSHVGQTPEETMRARLGAMARMEHDRLVCAIDDQRFALVEWGLAPAEVTPDVTPEPVDEPAYRGRERHPPLQEEYVPGGRRDDRRRHREEDDGRRRRRYPPPGEVAWALLRERGAALSLSDLVAELRAGDKVAEALERDLASFEKALREESRRRQDSGRGALFAFDGGTVRALEPQVREARKGDRGERPEGRGEARPDARRERPETRPAAFEEQRRQVLRSIRRRVGGLDIAALERLCVALLEAQGYRELNLGRRSAKEGPLYLARHRWGAGELRYAVRVLRPGRDVGRTEVADLRRDVSHFSAQLGIVFGTAECSREARGEANGPGNAPVMLYGGEALAEALLEAGLGVNRRLIEWFEFDDEFFARMGAGEPLDESPEAESPVEESPGIEVPAPAAAEAGAPAAGEQGGRERGRRGRDRRRDRRREGAGEGEAAARPGDESASTDASESAVPGELAARETTTVVPESVASAAAAPAETVRSSGSAPSWGDVISPLTESTTAAVEAEHGAAGDASASDPSSSDAAASDAAAPEAVGRPVDGESSAR